MTYQEAAVAAQAKARDILRTAMAVRILGRIEDAKASLVSAIKAYANAVVANARAAKDAAKAKEERAEKRDAFSQALGKVVGLSADDLALVTAAVEKQQAENDKKEAEEDEAATKYQADRLTMAKDVIDEARKELVRVQGNLTKLEAGEMKVDKEELDALTAKLLEDGKTADEGSAEAA